MLLLHSKRHVCRALQREATERCQQDGGDWQYQCRAHGGDEGVGEDRRGQVLKLLDHLGGHPGRQRHAAAGLAGADLEAISGLRSRVARLKAGPQMQAIPTPAGIRPGKKAQRWESTWTAQAM